MGLAQETFEIGVINSAKVMQTSAEGKKGHVYAQAKGETFQR